MWWLALYCVSLYIDRHIVAFEENTDDQASLNALLLSTNGSDVFATG